MNYTSLKQLDNVISDTLFQILSIFQFYLDNNCIKQNWIHTNDLVHIYSSLIPLTDREEVYFSELSRYLYSKILYFQEFDFDCFLNTITDDEYLKLFEGEFVLSNLYKRNSFKLVECLLLNNF